MSALFTFEPTVLKEDIVAYNLRITAVGEYIQNSGLWSAIMIIEFGMFVYCNCYP